MTKKISVVRALTLAGAVLFGVSAAAQAAPPTPPPGGAPAARVLMIDLRRVISESKVGHDIARQVELLKAQATKELDGEGRALQQEQVTLQQQAAILAPDVKARRIRDFEAKRAAFQDRVQKRSALIQGGIMKAQSQVEQALGPVLQGIMRERGATVLLDRSVVLLGPNAIDVTPIAIQRLDVKMSTVQVGLAEPPMQPGAAPSRAQ
jgi:outer membrane protein